MSSARKGDILSFRIPESDHDYVRSTAERRGISISEFIRIAIDRTRKEPGDNEPALAEVMAYLKKLTPSERDEILDKVEKTKKRRIRTFIKDAVSREPRIKKTKLCEMVSEEFNLPITQDFKHMVYLRIKSLRRRKRLMDKLEKEC